MATYTNNLNLKKPSTVEPALIADINNNADLVDAAVPNVFNVKGTAYGAKGDGVTDDTAAIVAALAACKATGGITYLPPGTYKVTSTVTLDSTFTGVTVRGAGRGKTIILSTINGASCLRLFNPGANVNIEGMTLQGRNPVNTPGEVGIFCQNHFRGCVRDVEIMQFGYDGLNSNAPSYCTYEVIWSHGNKNEGILINGQVDSASSVLANWVYQNGSHGIDINCQQIRVDGNKVFLNTGHGITAEANSPYTPTDFQITGNLVYSNTSCGISVSGLNTPAGNLVIAGNNVYSNGSNGDLGTGIRVVGGTGPSYTRVVIANNVIRGQNITGGTENRGIYAEYVANLVVTGNVSTDAGTYDLYLGANVGAERVISGNRFAATNVAHDQGGWTSWTPNWTGFSVNPTVSFARYVQIGKLVTVKWQLSANGTSNATTFTMTLPVTAREVQTGVGYCVGTDNGVAVATPIRIDLSSTTVATFFKDAAGAAWTNAGAKACHGTFTYEAA